MNRREFLGALGLALVFPKDAIQPFISAKKGCIADDFTISYCGDIRYTGNNENTYSCYEFYQYLKQYGALESVFDFNKRN